MPILSVDDLRGLSQAILEALGTPGDSARLVSASLVSANLAGHDSHGVRRLRSYAGLARDGQVHTAARPVVVARHQATAQLDGAWGWGQLAARLSAQTVIAMAEEYGVGVATIEKCNHIGRVGEYVESIADAGMIGIALCNAGPSVAPYGGYLRLLGTNPLAWAVPCGSNPALVLDIATSTVAEGKLGVAQVQGRLVPPGVIVDRSGQSSLDPAAYYAGGALLPFGGHKGYGISVMIEALGRGLAGTNTAVLPDHQAANGVVMLALQVSAFAPPERFAEEVEGLSAQIAAAPPAQGASAVLLPGEPEAIARQHRLAEGIPVSSTDYTELLALAGELNVTMSGWQE